MKQESLASRLRRWRAPLALLAITALGAVLRFVALGQIPGGLYHDEAFNGLDALQVLAGARPVWFVANNGREPLFIYLVALCVGIVGREPLAVRLPAAVLGTLTIPASYAMARAWFPARTRVALLTALFVAGTFWPLALSRMGFRAVALPLVAALLLAALGAWVGPGRGDARDKSRLYAALAGGLLGVAFYTYLSARFIPVALALFALWAWRAHALRMTRSEVALFLAGVLLVAAPLGLYAAAHPDIVFGRAEQVSIFSPAINGGDPAGALVRHTLAGLGMFGVRGDTIARHNLPGRPVFDPLTALVFLAGVLWCGWQALRVLGRSREPEGANCRPGAVLALVWVAVMLVPTILAEDTPHFLRAVGVLPVVCVFPALGIEWVIGRGRGRDESRPYWAGRLAAALVVTAGIGFTVHDYFVTYAALPKAATEFESAAVALAREARAFPGDVYLSARFWRDFETLPFMLPESPRLHLVEHPEQVAPAGPALLLLWPYDQADPVAGYLARLPAGQVLAAQEGPSAQGDLEPKAYPLYVAISSTAAPVATGSMAFAGGPSLRASSFATTTPTTVTVTLWWYAPAPIAADYTVYVHVLQDGAFLAGGDGQPGAGYLPMHLWRAGELVRDTHVVTLPRPFDPAHMTVRVGLYGPDGKRLAAGDDDGVTVPSAP